MKNVHKLCPLILIGCIRCITAFYLRALLYIFYICIPTYIFLLKFIAIYERICVQICVCVCSYEVDSERKCLYLLDGLNIFVLLIDVQWDNYNY